ncbi:IS1634 family transposase [Geoalkalibacter halelectricus]|uniref:IS1634 family transposase n=1 Tax=Geoalkalibacter halelectricus TaxID=2847045 RepID=UPI003D252542
MFIRIAKQKRGDKVYRHLQIAESIRDPTKGNAPRTRILAHLGTVEGLGEEQIEKLIAGLQRALGREATEPELLFARDFGHIHAAGGVWDGLGLSEVLDRCAIAGRSSVEVSALIRLLVVNRLCDPCSKLALLDWLESVWHDREQPPSYHHLLRAMDRLIGIKEKAEPLLAKAFLESRESVDLVFYDITSTYFEGERSVLEHDLRAYGYSRDHRRDRRQVVIGMVMTADGIPVCHHVFPGNTADKTTVAAVVTDLKQRFFLRRVIFVGDRGMLSDANLEHLLGEGVGFIVAHPLRKNGHATQVVGTLRAEFDESDEQEQYREDVRDAVRFVVAYAPQIAAEARRNRKERLHKADQWIAEQCRKLTNPSGRGKPATPQGSYDRIRDYLRDRNLLNLYDITLNAGELSVKKNRKALAWEEAIDGVLMLETTDLDLPAAEIVERYKELAEIERGWRTLKSSLLLRPVYHWTERRIRAHIFICVLALQLERWMRNRLKSLSVPKALQILQQIKVGELSVNGKRVAMTTRITAEQREILNQLGVKPIPAQLPTRQAVV